MTEVNSLITREELAQLTGIGIYKIRLASTQARYHFPQSVSPAKSRTKLFNRAEVLAWLDKNDLASMTISNLEKCFGVVKTGFDNQLAAQYLTRTRHGVFFPGLREQVHSRTIDNE